MTEIVGGSRAAGPADSDGSSSSNLPGGEHSIIVVGVWHNDSSAGVEVYCTTCGLNLLDSDDHGDVLTPGQIAAAVTAHSDESTARP